MRATAQAMEVPKRTGPHAFRLGFATHLLETHCDDGCDAFSRAAQELLGYETCPHQRRSGVEISMMGSSSPELEKPEKFPSWRDCRMPTSTTGVASRSAGSVVGEVRASNLSQASALPDDQKPKVGAIKQNRPPRESLPFKRSVIHHTRIAPPQTPQKETDTYGFSIALSAALSKLPIGAVMNSNRWPRNHRWWPQDQNTVGLSISAGH